MKKIILLLGILTFTSLVYGNSLLSEQGRWGKIYVITSGVILYYPFWGNYGDGGNAICTAQDEEYKKENTSFELINDSLSWGGSQPNTYYLTASNNYKTTLTLENVKRNDPNGFGNIIIINASKDNIPFIMKCTYTQ